MTTAREAATATGSAPLSHLTANATTAELLAMLAGEDAASLYRSTGRLRPLLDLIEEHPLDASTRARLLALRELVERMAAEPLTDGAVLTGPAASARLFAPMALLDHEEMHLALLTRRNTVLGVARVGLGGPDHVDVTAHQVFRPAIRRNAAGLVLAHNHPSGDVTPSEADRALTVRLVGAGRQLGIAVVDHLVIGTGGFFSFADDGTLS